MPLTLGNFKKKIFNTVMTAVASSDVFSPEIPSGTRRVTFQSRTASPVFFAWTFAEAQGTGQFMTLKAGGVYNNDGDYLDGSTDQRPFFRGSTAAQVIETEVWYTTGI